MICNYCCFRYHSLEGIHIFAAANMLQRIIVVLGPEIVCFGSNNYFSNELVGLYVPLVSATFASLNPLIIYFENGHFIPLIPRDPGVLLA
jgi:hypothetical protein